ncbi:MAG: DegT/DnrJ/EryC1/StrS aminotransferase family protein [Oligoflexia bacterium]|nr:DegT/DnrJ/EryC1/StrS aminotransferase family protein [Oligoflexia bacterium]
MENNITKKDLNSVVDFLNDGVPILTQSTKVREFEEKWSNWLGVKYSVFVNSGSSANILTMSLLKEILGSGEIIIPPLAWVSDVVSVIKAGFRPVFADINMKNLALDTDEVLKKININTKAVFLTHILGFNGLTTKLLTELKERKIILIEDVCESYGATFNGVKLGTFGLISNFSFYYAHHLSTIEGGMISTNDYNVFQMARVFRSHGMVREASDDNFKNDYIERYRDLYADFIFAYPSSNYRNTEINAVIGLSQIERIDDNNKKRIKNFKIFLNNLDNKKYYTDFDIEGSCNYAFVLILKKPDMDFCNKVMLALKNANVEFRRGTSGGGNQLRQPYLKNIIPNDYYKIFTITEYIHFFGFYIGNYPDLEENKILKLCNLLNNI